MPAKIAILDIERNEYEEGKSKKWNKFGMFTHQKQLADHLIG